MGKRSGLKRFTRPVTRSNAEVKNKSNTFLGNTFSTGWLGSGRKKRQDINEKKAAEEAALAKQQAEAQAIADKERAIYEGPGITAGEQTGIDRQKEIMTAKMRQSLGEAGIASGTSAVQTSTAIKQAGESQYEVTRNQHLKNSLAAIGIDTKGIDAMMQVRASERDAFVQSFVTVIRGLSAIGAAAMSPTKTGDTGTGNNYDPTASNLHGPGGD